MEACDRRIEKSLRRILRLLEDAAVRPPASVDLWSAREIGAYLKRSERVVREKIAVLPGFPCAIRLPVAGAENGKGNPLWKAREVIAWAERHQERPEYRRGKRLAAIERQPGVENPKEREYEKAVGEIRSPAQKDGKVRRSAITVSAKPGMA